FGANFNFSEPLISFSSAQKLNFKQGTMPNEIIIKDNACGIDFNYTQTHESGTRRFSVNQTATQYEINFETSSKISSLIFFDQSGMRISDSKITFESIHAQGAKANISKLNPGLYFIQAQFEDGGIETGKIFKID
ncbi:MAG TPA: T9SS type A sorting domain-containing protein, partial [Saprospiraceae bacterium]|nr:T9SS type A sorting domain-containing protein [Saprospiraceae bacterium]